MSDNPQPNLVDRFLRRKDVEAAIGYSRSSIYRLIQLGEFPRPIALTCRSVRWRASDVAAWQRRKFEQDTSQKNGGIDGGTRQNRLAFLPYKSI